VQSLPARAWALCLLESMALIDLFILLIPSSSHSTFRTRLNETQFELQRTCQIERAVLFPFKGMTYCSLGARYSISAPATYIALPNLGCRGAD
jgi:hypothetical protein